MRKEELEDKLLNEYVEVDSYEPCSVPLKQATKILGIKRGDLPTIRMPVVNLIDCFKWLEKEKTKGQLIYNTHIENTKQCLIEQYPEIKVKMVGEDGNAFAILGRVTKALRNARVPLEERKKFQAEAMKTDYNNVLQTVMRWVSTY